MNTIANIIDYLLWAMVAVSYGIIIYKSIEFWIPSLIGKESLEKRIAHDNPAQIDEDIESIEEGVHYLSIFASSSPFIGLAGTVIHIITALKNMQSAGLDITIISGPIATALTATLVGLAVALPSMIAYNIMVRRLQVAQNRAYRVINAKIAGGAEWQESSENH